jgi:signal transduction histidine kinase
LALAAWLQAAGGPALDPIAEEILVRVMLFSIVGYVVVRLSAAQREQRRALARKNADLAHYATTLEQLAISRERNRLARELHDTLAHTLSAMSVQLQALEVLLDGDLEAARATLRTLQDMTRQGVGEARRALGALRASPLEDLGLLEALRRLAESTAERAGLRLALDLPDSLDDLRPDLEQHLYRIAEEALANVVRHANAATLTVRLRQRGDGVTLLIADDGLGFDPATATADGHYGLRGIQERARLVGGALTIDSQPGQGARLALSVKDAT